MGQTILVESDPKVTFFTSKTLPDIPVTPDKRPYESDSNSYYPLGSEDSSHRPTSPRFTVEEVSNYEPVAFGRSSTAPQKSTPVAKSPNLARAVMTKEMVRSATSGPRNESKAGSESPALPKRHPVVKLRDQRSKSRDPGGEDIEAASSSDGEHADDTKSDDEDARSAFDSATFYVWQGK